METTNIQLQDKETTINQSLTRNFRMETAESLDALISMVGCTGDFEEEQYNGGFQNMEETGDEDELSGGCGGGGHGAQMKKRRLSLQQVRSLEKNFEVENKLEPDRKVQLAKELGLQPRQVAVWFQNRRARWKTKQLERDYGVLKLNYDALKSSFDAMQRDNQKLTSELSSLRNKVEEAGKRKDDVTLMNGHCSSGDNDAPDNNVVVDTKPIRAMVLKQDHEDKEEIKGVIMNGIIVFNERLEGSESDSSAILNDNAAVAGAGGNNSPHPIDSSAILNDNAAVAGAGGNNSPHPIDSYISTTSSLKYITYVQPDNDSKSCGEGPMDALRAGNNNVAAKAPASAAYNPQQCFRMDDTEESCNFFNVDDSAAATLPWWEWP